MYQISPWFLILLTPIFIVIRSFWPLILQNLGSCWFQFFHQTLHIKSMGQSINNTSCHDIYYGQIKSIIIMVISKGSSNIFYAFPLTYRSIMKKIFMPHQKYLCQPWKLFLKIAYRIISPLGNQIVTPLAGSINVDWSCHKQCFNSLHTMIHQTTFSYCLLTGQMGQHDQCDHDLTAWPDDRTGQCDMYKWSKPSQGHFLPVCLYIIANI